MFLSLLGFFGTRRQVRQQVSILTGPFGPVQPGPPGERPGGARSFNPHRPFRAGATLRGAHGHFAPLRPVSILTGPFGPVQPLSPCTSDHQHQRFQSSPALSGRCNQPRLAMLPGPRARCFNPHRPFRAGATIPGRVRAPRRTVFQSSPALSGRCNATSTRTNVTRRRCGFNPHRPFRAGATPSSS